MAKLGTDEMRGHGVQCRKSNFLHRRVLGTICEKVPNVYYFYFRKIHKVPNNDSYSRKLRVFKKTVRPQKLNKPNQINSQRSLV